MHPTLRFYRSHPAIDDAAPKGTPVKTVKGGKVAAMGTSPTMGNHVMSRHANGCVTRYFHLSRFARGLALNKPVARGDLIGYVGRPDMSPAMDSATAEVASALPWPARARHTTYGS